MSEKVLEDATDDGFEEEVPNFIKARRASALPARMVPDPNNGGAALVRLEHHAKYSS